jgi:glycosyltransferase involved in cell wall biosynthesis
MNLSVVIPAYNEEDNVEATYLSVATVLDAADLARYRPWEIIFIDDGSTDATGDRLRTLCLQDPRVTVVQLIRNFGQTSALACGIQHASGQVIVSMDCDFQNDPADIPKLLARLEEGAEIACAFRNDRRDWRRIPTGFANWIVRKVTRVNLHDCAFPLKAFRRRWLDEIRLCGDMHRYLAIHASWWGAVPFVEVPVRHRFRQSGKSNYGAARVWKILPDMMLIGFLERYARRPIHFFGGGALMFWAAGVAAGIFAILRAPDRASSMVLAVVAAGLMLTGGVVLMCGLIAELVMRTYYELAHKTGATRHHLWPLYVVKEVWRHSECAASAAGSDHEI